MDWLFLSIAVMFVAFSLFSLVWSTKDYFDARAEEAKARARFFNGMADINPPKDETET